MSEYLAHHVATAFAPAALSAPVPMIVARHGTRGVIELALACSLACAATLFDAEIERGGPGAQILFADPFATHDRHCDQCHHRVS